jgi:SAM-dependent methyltransferase
MADAGAGRPVSPGPDAAARRQPGAGQPGAGEPGAGEREPGAGQPAAGQQGAGVHWDRVWATGQRPARWSEPDPWVCRVARQVRSRGGARVLDLGCGIGRHTLMLAGAGFEAYGLDSSTAGIARTRGDAAAMGVPAQLLVADFTRLPYRSGVFDYVLAWNVVYHGDAGVAAAAVTEVARVLRPGGVYQATMLSKRNALYGAGQQISRDTYVLPDGPDDKAHPHLYSDHGDVLRLHRGFHLLTAVEQEQAGAGDWHWHLLFEVAVDGASRPRWAGAADPDGPPKARPGGSLPSGSSGSAPARPDMPAPISSAGQTGRPPRAQLAGQPPRAQLAGQPPRAQLADQPPRAQLADQPPRRGEPGS